MPGTRGTNTMAEGLRQLLADIAYLKTAPDADIELLVSLETQILQAIRAPVEQAVQSALPQLQGISAQSGMAPGGGMGPGGSGPYMGPGPGGPASNVMPGAGMPNADELRRLIGSQPPG